MSFEEALKEHGVKGLEKMYSWLETTENFVAEQAPLVVEEVIRWGMVKHAFFAILFTLITGLCFYMWHRVKDNDFEESLEANHPGLFIWWVATKAAPFIGIIAAPIVASYHLYYFIYVWVAPRLYIMNEIAEIIGKAKGTQ